MRVTIEIPNEQLFEKILWLLDAFKSEGLKIIPNNQKKVIHTIKPSPQKGLDFSSFQIESFKEVDGLEYQKRIRDEW